MLPIFVSELLRADGSSTIDLFVPGSEISSEYHGRSFLWGLYQSTVISIIISSL